MGFGSFQLLCERADIPLCPLVGPYSASTAAFSQGVLSHCYARSIDLANTLIFNVGNVFIQFGTMLVVAIIIYNSYQKYTAVGRREMLDLFYLYFFLTVWSLVVDSGVVPANSASYPYFVAIQAGISSAVCLLLALTSFLGFQFWEDGSFASVWGMRVFSTLWGCGVFVTAILTFKSWGGLDPTNTLALMITLYLVNAIFVFVYVCVSLYITAILLKEWWAFGAVLLGTFFFIVGQVLMYGFGSTICDRVKHYIDGVFFATVCNMFGILMVYKSWDIYTSEDLEFCVSNAETAWDMKPGVEDQDLSSEYAMSNYNIQTPYI